MNCYATVLLRYYGYATVCIGHVTKEIPTCHNMLHNFVFFVCSGVFWWIFPTQSSFEYAYSIFLNQLLE
jgi:hypothetical protein